MAVVVTYQPDVDLLAKVIHALQGQVERVLVFDNASRPFDISRFMDGIDGLIVDVRVSPENVGIAAAINAGFAKAAGLGFTHLLILDQDSIAASDMVEHLLQAFFTGKPDSAPVAAAGPAFVDRKSRVAAPFVRIGPLVNRKLFAGEGEMVEVDFLISSGTLVPLAVIDNVGAMAEKLFIDNVDLEWSFRARDRGYRLLGVGSARMEHSIGDSVKTISLFGRSWEVSLHSPVRLYYMTRNRLWLYTRAETPVFWISQDIPRLLLKLLGMSLLVAPRWRNCRAMWSGMVDALRGRLGPTPADY